MSNLNTNNKNNLLINWALGVIAIMITAYILPGVSVSFLGAVVGAVVLGAINVFVRPILLILTLPITFLTLGLFIFVIDAFLVWLGSLIIPGFSIVNFWWALGFSIVLTVINLGLDYLSQVK